MGNEDEADFELEMLRQAALSSLQKNRANKAVKKGHLHHRTTGSNKNLIQIHTTNLIEEEEDPDCEEIVIAEGSDVNDSDCDEVIEEVMLSDGDEGVPGNSPTSSEDPQNQHNINTLQINQSDGSQLSIPCPEEESSSDDDALSVASRYSLYEDEPDSENNSLQRLPVRLRGPAHINPTKDEEFKSHQRKRTRSRSRDRSRSPFMSVGRGRRRRSGSRSPPLRRRPRRSRSRSHGREIRRRSVSRDPPQRISDNSRDKPRRKEESRRPPRSSPSPPIKSSRRDHSRRKSRSLSRDKSRTTDANTRTTSKKVESSTESRKSPEPHPMTGADQEVFEKRRRKFQDQIPLNRVEGKKISLQSKVVEKEKAPHHDEPDKRDKNKSVQKSIVLKDKDSSSSSSADFDKGRLGKEINERKRKSRTGKEKGYEAEEVKAEEEDLRAKLIKKKMKAQQQGNMGSGRIFTEALKGTRLISNKESSSRKGLKRKVSLTFG